MMRLAARIVTYRALLHNSLDLKYRRCCRAIPVLRKKEATLMRAMASQLYIKRSWVSAGSTYPVSRPSPCFTARASVFEKIHAKNFYQLVRD